MVTNLDLLVDSDLMVQLERGAPRVDLNLSPLIPDFPPKEWEEPAAEEPPG